MRFGRFVTASLLLALALSGCGKRATTLERGPPLWGESAKAQYRAEKAAQKAEEERRAAQKKAEEEGTAPPASTPDSTPKS